MLNILVLIHFLCISINHFRTCMLNCIHLNTYLCIHLNAYLCIHALFFGITEWVDTILNGRSDLHITNATMLKCTDMRFLILMSSRLGAIGNRRICCCGSDIRTSKLPLYVKDLKRFYIEDLFTSCNEHTV